MANLKVSYINTFLIMTIVVLLIGCSSNSTKRSVIVPEGEPEWLYSPQSGCDEKNEICASGEGINFNQSDSHARKSLASIFETKITICFRRR